MEPKGPSISSKNLLKPPFLRVLEYKKRNIKEFCPPDESHPEFGTARGWKNTQNFLFGRTHPLMNPPYGFIATTKPNVSVEGDRVLELACLHSLNVFKWACPDRATVHGTGYKSSWTSLNYAMEKCLTSVIFSNTFSKPHLNGRQPVAFSEILVVDLTLESERQNISIKDET